MGSCSWPMVTTCTSQSAGLCWLPRVRDGTGWTVRTEGMVQARRVLGAEKRPVWSMHQLGAGRKLGNREEGSAVHIQLRRHSHCVNNAIHASESFCFTLH